MDHQHGHDAANYGIACFAGGHGLAVESPVTHLTRHLVVFALPEPAPPLRASEVLPEFKLRLNGRPAYAGRAVVRHLIADAGQTIVEATLEEGWMDAFTAAPDADPARLGQAFDGFLQHWQRTHRLNPELKILMADMQTFLADMRLWLEQVELGLESLPKADRQDTELELAAALAACTRPALLRFFERFEEVCRGIEPDLQPAHRNYVKRQIHPLVLCAPFMHRSFVKPLGYAGDYEMVNMMLRDARAGESLYAKVLNVFFLDTPPVIAHRNRLALLREVLISEVARRARERRRARIFNLGCGPALEVQAFIEHDDLSSQADFTLLDFSDETIRYTGDILAKAIAREHRSTTVRMVRKNVVGFIKEAGRHDSGLGAASYDFVYCSGLFDYLADNVCQKLMDLLYGMLAPGGLLLATNVTDYNPSRNWMEYSVDWHLIYRNAAQMRAICPAGAAPDLCRIRDEPSGVNTFLEIRKPA